MNAVQLPTTAGEWFALLVRIFTDALHTAVTNPWWLTFLLTCLVVVAATYCGAMGNDETGPFLTEAEREAAR